MGGFEVKKKKKVENHCFKGEVQNFCTTNSPSGVAKLMIVLKHKKAHRSHAPLLFFCLVFFGPFARNRKRTPVM